MCPVPSPECESRREPGDTEISAVDYSPPRMKTIDGGSLAMYKHVNYDSLTRFQPVCGEMPNIVIERGKKE